MRKTIVIGESVFDTVFHGDKPVRSFVGGRIANAAASAGMAGLSVEMVSECGNDHIGDIIINFMRSHNVGTASVDRFTDGSSAVSMIFETDGGKKLINFYNYPDDRFDVVWPRIDKDDVIIFGSFYSIDTVMREQLYELVKYAHERKAIIIYLMGCQHGINCRITKVMPGILENLEMADIVIATQGDIDDIFPGETADQAYKNHIEFYCDNFLHIDDRGQSPCITVYHRIGTKSRYPLDSLSCELLASNKLGWQAGLTSGIAYSLYANDILHQQVYNATDLMDSIIATAIEFANNAAADPQQNCIDADFGRNKAEQLERHYAQQQQEEETN